MASVHEGLLDELRALIRTCPIVDNHAHNLLRLDGLKSAGADFLTISTEATGKALEDTSTSLSHLRALVQLRKLYGLPSDADWATIVQRRRELLDTNPEHLVRQCFEGTQTLLIDDGLGPSSGLERYDWHNSFTLSPCKRIVRIETVAASILSDLHRQGKLPTHHAIRDAEACRHAWVTFITAFEEAIARSISDEEVVGFKSVVCYRTGLDVVVGPDSVVSETGLTSFRRHYLLHCASRDFRVEVKGMNDALVISTFKLISESVKQSRKAKPFQFHTGLGDNDISLLESNPAYLQPVIKAFPDVPVVLLHTAYPYTREAGYLATVYKNAYLDIGEVFMMVSRDGLEKIFRQALELTPTSKILYSSDGHHFPETFWLANRHGREIIESVMCEYVTKGDLAIAQARDAVYDMFFENSNQLYGLGLKRPDLRSSKNQINDKYAIASHALSPMLSATSSPYNSQLLASFSAQHVGTQFVFVQWLDFLGQMRSRCLPTREFESLIQNGRRINISTGNLGTTQNDHMSSACNPVGAISVEPDLSSLRSMQDLGPVKHASTVMSRFTDADGNGLDLCPRSALKRVLQDLEKEHSVEFLLGFEIEITFCKLDTGNSAGKSFIPLDTNHAWGSVSDEQYTSALPLMLLITTALQNIGIHIQQMHSEAGAGQYEFVLPPQAPILAIDTLLQARQAITQIAATHHLRATCHPQPFPGIGTAAHAHVSFNSTKLSPAEIEELEMHFMASLLTHLPAVCAFTMPQAVSYGRVVEDSWTGGTSIAWGTENREVPLRRVPSGRRWEIRCLDGLANMYLALHAIFAVGLLGVRKKSEMVWSDCLKNPTQLTEAEKNDLGITTKLPASLDQSLQSLTENKEVEDAMSPGIVQHYLALKEAEQKMLNEMPIEDRQVWLMERY